MCRVMGKRLFSIGFALPGLGKATLVRLVFSISEVVSKANNGQVAEETGCSNARYFASCFKNITDAPHRVPCRRPGGASQKGE